MDPLPENNRTLRTITGLADWGHSYKKKRVLTTHRAHNIHTARKMEGNDIKVFNFST